MNKILDQKGIKAKIYIAAVGGYNSGQELLKLIRDYPSIKPDIHISYSGANDPTSSSYASGFERSILNNAIQSNGIFPNTKSLFLANRKSSLHLYEEDEIDPLLFWKNNQHAMHALSVENSYHFASILQPVLMYTNKNINPKGDLESTQYFLNANNQAYPSFISLADSVVFINNFTNVFSEYADSIVFKDDCHLISDKYNKKLAERIFELLECENFLSPVN